MNPLVTLVLTYDLSYKVISDFKGKKNHLSIYSSLYHHMKIYDCNSSICEYNMNGNRCIIPHHGSHVECVQSYMYSYASGGLLES